MLAVMLTPQRLSVCLLDALLDHFTIEPVCWFPPLERVDRCLCDFLCDLL